MASWFRLAQQVGRPQLRHAEACYFALLHSRPRELRLENKNKSSLKEIRLQGLLLDPFYPTRSTDICCQIVAAKKTPSAVHMVSSRKFITHKLGLVSRRKLASMYSLKKR